MPVINPIPQTYSSHGTFTGNDTANRAIPHGLGITPSAVLLYEDGGGSYLGMILADNADVHFADELAAGKQAVTIVDATNFYVGNAGDYNQSFNANTVPIYWAALT